MWDLSPPAVEARSLNHWTAAEVPAFNFFRKINLVVSVREVIAGWPYSNAYIIFCKKQHMILDIIAFYLLDSPFILLWPPVVIPNILEVVLFLRCIQIRLI